MKMKVFEAYVRRLVEWWKGLHPDRKIALSIVAFSLIAVPLGLGLTKLIAVTPDSPKSEPVVTPTLRPSSFDRLTLEERLDTAEQEVSKRAETLQVRSSLLWDEENQQVFISILDDNDDNVSKHCLFMRRIAQEHLIGLDVTAAVIKSEETSLCFNDTIARPTPTPRPDPRRLYTTIDIRELESYADDHIGRRVKVEGEVFNILEDGLQMWVDVPGSDFDTVAVAVAFGDVSLPRVYEGDLITVYGIVSGTIEGTNSFGGAISQPLVIAKIIEK
jgi:hypothetical protein